MKELIVKPITYGGYYFEPESVNYTMTIDPGAEDSVTALIRVSHEDGQLICEFEWVQDREFHFPSFQHLVNYLDLCMATETWEPPKNIPWRNPSPSDTVDWQVQWEMADPLEVDP